MGELLQPQIRDSCKLALPEGLKDLMSDISREVLRAQPENVYQFITDYLSAMLIAREKLTIASHVFNDICACSCHPELDEELRNVGLDDEEIEETKKIIIHYFEKDNVKEESLLVKLMKLDIDAEKLPAIQEAIKAAYKRNQLNKNTIFDTSSGDENNSAKAAKHTLEMYWMRGPPEELFYPTPVEEERQFYDQGVDNQEYDCPKTKTSSTESSADIFDNIKYDGGITDLFVSTNCKPYKNSSLTSLAGSYGKLRPKGKPTISIPEEKNASHEGGIDKESINPIADRLQKRQVYMDISEEDMTREKDQPITDIDEQVFEEGNEEFDKQRIEDIQDEAEDADNESDTSIDEVINTK